MALEQLTIFVAHLRWPLNQNIILNIFEIINLLHFRMATLYLRFFFFLATHIFTYFLLFRMNVTHHHYLPNT